jgi:hypothetical protein
MPQRRFYQRTGPAAHTLVAGFAGSGDETALLAANLLA